MKRYDEYIETGDKFLPQLPSGWELKLGRSCFEENKKKAAYATFFLAYPKGFEPSTFRVGV